MVTAPTYPRPSDIPDQDIRDAFAENAEVRFSARNYNCVEYRCMGIGKLGWWIPLEQVLPALGITPRMLRPVFIPQTTWRKRRFPFNLPWFGFNPNHSKLKAVNFRIPKNVAEYKQLGSFPLEEQRFIDLTKILGKSVAVWREDGGTGEHYYIFTAHSSGEITKPS